MFHKQIYLWLLFLSFSVHAQNNLTWNLTPVPRDSEQIPIYVNCKNKFSSWFYDSENKGQNLKDVQYQSDNGEIAYDAKKNIITIIPDKAGKLKIKVQKSGNKIGTIKLKTIEVPPPTIYLTDSQGKYFNFENPIAQPKMMEVIIKADAVFEYMMPDEANYEVRKISVIHFRGGKIIAVYTYQKKTISFKKIITHPGDAFQITVEEVVRKGSKNQYFKTSILNPVRSFQVK